MSNTRPPSDLPVAAVLPEVVAASRTGAVVVTAPPGSGKTTLFPAAVLNDVPAALLNPWYLIVATAGAAAALLVHGNIDAHRRNDVLVVAGVLAVAWFAAVGASKAHAESIPFPGAIVVGVIGGIASRWIVDVATGFTPFHLQHGASYVGSAVVVAVVYLVATELGLPIWPASLIAVLVGSVYRLAGIRRGLEGSSTSAP